MIQSMASCFRLLGSFFVSWLVGLRPPALYFAYKRPITGENRTPPQTCPTTQSSGFTLIEVVLFIVLISLIGSGVLLPFSLTLQKAPKLTDQTKALALAQEHMELVLEQRYIDGFTNFADPCTFGSPPAACTLPTGFSVTTNVASGWSSISSYTLITVTISGDGDAALQTLVTGYTP